MASEVLLRPMTVATKAIGVLVISMALADFARLVLGMSRHVSGYKGCGRLKAKRTTVRMCIYIYIYIYT